MTNQMVLPQEIETFYIIPSLRRQFAMEMKGLSMKQKDIASILGIQSAAISQYASAKRGHKVAFPESIQQEIKHSAPRIKDRISYVREMQRLLYIIRLSGSLCEVHKQLSDVPNQCELQAAGCHMTARGA